jgi:hypothetical protein
MCQTKARARASGLSYYNHLITRWDAIVVFMPSAFFVRISPVDKNGISTRKDQRRIEKHHRSKGEVPYIDIG